MNIIYNIQINDEVIFYGIPKQKSEIEFENGGIGKYFGLFSFIDVDDQYQFDFSVNLSKKSECKVKVNDFQVADVIITLITDDSSIDHKIIQDQIAYILFEKISEINDEFIEGVESDQESENDENKPYNPELIRVDPKQMSISYIYESINDYGSLELSADFQRNFIWTDAKRKSRLIESILLRIPLPAFYFSTDKQGNYQIVDGIQRITVINMFINGEFKLADLEYLEDCQDCFFSLKHDKSKKHAKRKYLDSKYIRRILETQLSINVIDPQTPIQVKYDIFKRLNTGGKPLNNMEIRNSFASVTTRKYIRDLTKTKEYKSSSLSSVNSTRFADQELILRFICFYRFEIKHDNNFAYKGNMDTYLDNAIEYLNNSSKKELSEMEADFKTMLKLANDIFGRYAFRKVYPNSTVVGNRLSLINKSLFTAMSIVIIKYKDELKNYEFKSITENIESLASCIDKDSSYYDSLSFGTNDRMRIKNVFEKTENFMRLLVGGKLNDSKNNY